VSPPTLAAGVSPGYGQTCASGRILNAFGTCVRNIVPAAYPAAFPFSTSTGACGLNDRLNAQALCVPRGIGCAPHPSKTGSAHADSGMAITIYSNAGRRIVGRSRQAISLFSVSYFDSMSEVFWHMASFSHMVSALLGNTICGQLPPACVLTRRFVRWQQT